MTNPAGKFEHVADEGGDEDDAGASPNAHPRRHSSGIDAPAACAEPRWQVEHKLNVAAPTAREQPSWSHLALHSLVVRPCSCFILHAMSQDSCWLHE